MDNIVKMRLYSESIQLRMSKQLQDIWREFVLHPQKVITHKQICKIIDSQASDYSNTSHSIIKRLKKTLKGIKIVNVHGVGFYYEPGQVK